MLAVHRAMERQNLIEEVRNLRVALDGRYGFENIVGRSKPLLRVLEQASRVAQHALHSPVSRGRREQEKN